MNNAGILVMIVFALVGLLIFLIMLYIFISRKNNNKNEEQKSEGTTSENKSGYNIQSIFKFMNFEKIEDNMIVQKKGKKFLMVIECQGINYDLMSEIEKNGVESGYIGFLNSLKQPVQIHIQTRTINLEQSINNYKYRLEEIEKQLNEQEEQLKQIYQKENYSTKQLNDKQLEVIRLRNLYSYGKDIIKNTEAMSLNKNILRKKYYIISSYYYSSTDKDELLSDAEISEIAFSELYTRCQSMIRILSTTGVSGKVLDSYELADLLYNAYNRDGAETFGIDKAVNAGYDEMYVTAPDVMDKKINILDKMIEDKALDLVENAVLKVNEEKKKELEQKEKNLDDLVNQLAQTIIVENADDLGIDIAKKSLEYIDELNNNGKEVDTDVKEEKGTRRRKKQ